MCNAFLIQLQSWIVLYTIILVYMYEVVIKEKMAFTNNYNAGITRREMGFNHSFLIGM